MSAKCLTPAQRDYLKAFDRLMRESDCERVRLVRLAIAKQCEAVDPTRV